MSERKARAARKASGVPYRKPEKVPTRSYESPAEARARRASERRRDSKVFGGVASLVSAMNASLNRFRGAR